MNHVADLRCARHLHGKVEPGVLVVRCQQCSRDAGHDVFHRWDVRTWQMIGDATDQEANTNREPDPNARFPD